MSVLAFLILAPLLMGFVMLAVQSDRLRRFLVTATVALVAIGSINLVVKLFPDVMQTFQIESHSINFIILLIEILMSGYLVYIGFRYRRALIVGLTLAQLGLILWLEFFHGSKIHVQNNLLVDKFSIIMALINGLVGGVICLYALGYMKEMHEQHPEIKDRRPFFFSLLFIFTGAMFGVVFSNNLLWLFFFWEITTLCSFFLIGYKQTDESVQNALRALLFNLIGGLAFAMAIVWFYLRSNSLELSVMLRQSPEIVLAPVALLGFAGLTKSAQMPFSRWLLGAMVAPTPVSALLHSSTMVKAGVYLIIRLAPVLYHTAPGIVIAMVGAVTFLIGSFAAVCTSDAKKVLAYSTVANLGLIVLCGGIGTYEAVWAGILLIVFHAVAKCLLFLCVGVVEHKLHSRNIEDMSGLILSMPKISIMLQIGIAGMFLAPFGMLISKWAVLKAVVDSYPLLTVFIVFGSAPTLFFWVKWLGKMIEVTRPMQNVEKNISTGEWVALYFLAGTTWLTCLFFPALSTYFIEPYLMEIYTRTATMGPGNYTIMTIMLAMVCLFPLSFINYGRRVKVMSVYLGGANTEKNSTDFTGSAGTVHSMGMKNFYFETLVSEERLFETGVFAGASLLVFLISFVVL